MYLNLVGFSAYALWGLSPEFMLGNLQFFLLIYLSCLYMGSLILADVLPNVVGVSVVQNATESCNTFNMMPVV